MIEFGSFDVVVYANYEKPGEAYGRALDHIGECWPQFSFCYEDLTLADYLTGEDDVDSEEVLTGEVEGRCSWVAHKVLLPFAFDLQPWAWSRASPTSWWVRIQYAEVLDGLRLEVYRHGVLQRLIRCSTEMPWVLFGDPLPWEAEIWDGLQPQGGEFADRPDPLTLLPPGEQVPLSDLLVLTGGSRGVAGGGSPREHTAELGTVDLRDGRTFWRALKPAPRANALAITGPGSFIDAQGLAHIDLENFNLRPDATLAKDSEEWPDVHDVCEAAMHHLLGVRSLTDLARDDWTGNLVSASTRA